MHPLLTIAIPTYNRSKYLAELLPQITAQCRDEEPGKIEVLVIDNASTDDSRELVEANYRQRLNYIRNSENIGADKNFIKCVETAKGKYVWLFGDDEILRPNGIRRVVAALENAPDFLIVESDFEQTATYPSYRQLLQAAAERDPIFPVHHTLITRNIFPKSGFDLAAARNNLPTSYCHMYAVLEHISNAASIAVLSKLDAAISVRDVRPDFADPPSNLEAKLVQLSRRIAEAVHYPPLRTDIWLFYNARPLYKLRRSRKVRKFLKMFS